jgi:formyl-CoA transferase
MAAPYQAVRAGDGYFVMGANNDRLWTRLCHAIERPDLLTHADYATNALRLANRPKLIAELETTFATRGCREWVEILLAAGIPAGLISDYAEVFASEHAKAREAMMEIDHPVEGRVPNIGFPVKLSGTPARVWRHPPLLGEHNEEIAEELRRRKAAPRTESVG